MNLRRKLVIIGFVNPHVLIIDDDPGILRLIKEDFQERGFTVVGVLTGSAGLRSVQTNPPDCVVLDWKLPDISGIDVLKLIRKDAKTRHVPVVMLTVVDSIQSKVQAFDEGEADDYLTKPFAVEELLVRIKAVLRRKGGLPPTGVLRRGVLRIDNQKREAFVEDKPVSLTPKEFDLLTLLFKKAGFPLTRQFLLDHVWGYEDDSGGPRTVDTHIANLREKLGKAGHYIKTIREVGYMFDSRT